MTKEVFEKAITQDLIAWVKMYNINTDEEMNLAPDASKTERDRFFKYYLNRLCEVGLVGEIKLHDGTWMYRIAPKSGHIWKRVVPPSFYPNSGTMVDSSIERAKKLVMNRF